MAENKHYRLASMFKLVKKMKSYYPKMALSSLSGIGHNLCNISVACICGYMVSLAIKGTLLTKWMPLITALVVVIIFRALFYYGEMWFSHDVAFRILADFRIMLFKAVDRTCPGLLLNMRSGQLASTLMSDVELLEWFFAHTFGTVIVAVAVPLITLIFLGTLNIVLPLIMLIFLIIVVIIPLIMKKKADKQGAIVRECLADANSVAIEGFHGLKEILTLNYQNQYKKKNAAYMEKLYQAQIGYGKRLGTEGALMQICVGIAMISMMVTSIVLIFHGKMAVQWFPVVIIIAGMTFNPVLEICNMARNFGLILSATDRVFAVLEAKSLVEDKAKDYNIANIKPSIEFTNVSFSYKDDSENVLNGVSFKIPANKKVAIVGHSGAGKSTCINLLLRYWDVRGGSVKIGDIDLRDMSLNTLRNLTSGVLQEVYLFNISIRENIRLGKIGASDAEVENAAKLGLAHDFISEFPQGYDTIAGERGTQLSGGQRQRIAIARAILKGAPILILDEAVSNLDTENENAIHESFKNMESNPTIFIVAHRLSTIKSADCLVVMDKGKVMEIGTHAELIAKNGFYAKLISCQTWK
ncbi:MAG: ABC transporter ATP-binding protein [Clostridiales bacterium]